MNKLTYGSVCSGIEAASVAWEPLGMKPVWFSEIEKFPCKVLAYHWPDVPNLGDMIKLPGMVRSGDTIAPDVLVGGTPCQAFSAAGKQLSLEDARGQLSLVYGDLLNAIDEKRLEDGQEAAIAVWENVPGVLNTKDNAFGWFLGVLAGEFTLGDCLSGSAKALEAQPGSSRQKWSKSGCVIGPKRTVAWRVLDAQYFGLAQRRKRVFVIASARGGFDPAEVLFERECVRQDTPPSRGARKETARGAGISPTGNNGVPSRERGMTINGDNSVGADCVCIQNATRGKSQGGLGVSYAGVSYTLDVCSIHAVMCIDPPHLIRQQTPTEYERLQGFPEGHTNIPGAADGNRRKALGNSKAVRVVVFIGKRIIKQLNSRRKLRKRK